MTPRQQTKAKYPTAKHDKAKLGGFRGQHMIVVGDNVLAYGDTSDLAWKNAVKKINKEK